MERWLKIGPNQTKESTKSNEKMESESSVSEVNILDKEQCVSTSSGVKKVAKKRKYYRVSSKIRQGLILLFFRKITPGLILGGYHLFSFIKNKIAKKKITRFSNTQNMKTDIHLLINNTFLFKNSCS